MNKKKVSEILTAINTLEALLTEDMPTIQYLSVEAGIKALKASVADNMLDTSMYLNNTAKAAKKADNLDDQYWVEPYGKYIAATNKTVDWNAITRSQDEVNLTKAYMDTFSRPSIAKYL